MAYTEINGPGYKQERWAIRDGVGYNGCSGVAAKWYPAESNKPPPVDPWGSPTVKRNFWERIDTGETTMSINFIEPGLTLPKFKPSACPCRAFMVRQAGKPRIVLGVNDPEMWEDENVTTAEFYADPQERASFAPMFDSGYWLRPYVPELERTASPKGRYEITAHRDAIDRIMLTTEAGTVRRHIVNWQGDGNREDWTNVTYPESHWSNDGPHFTDGRLPWWAIYEAYGIKDPGAAAIRDAVFDEVLGEPEGDDDDRVLWAAGSMYIQQAHDSSRIIWAFYDLDPDGALDMSKETYMEVDGVRVYYKIVPFYYHSPLHEEHRVVTMYFSLKPLTMVELGG